MNARNIAYWSTTALLAAAVLGSGLGKLAGAEPLVESMAHLGYPTYLLTILGAWMVAGAVVLLAPGFARVKEWAYAGIVFQMTGAFASHLFAGDAIATAAPTLFLTGLAVASYMLRPESRRIVTVGTPANSPVRPAVRAAA